VRAGGRSYREPASLPDVRLGRERIREMVRQAFSRIAAGWRDVVRELTDPYRPELHYMRGPGPKSIAKRGNC
jgi:hypothetical protein